MSTALQFRRPNRRHLRGRMMETRLLDRAGLGPTPASLVSAAIGVALELAVHALTGRREAWDSELFWAMGLPIAIAAAFGVGLVSAGRAWLGTAWVAPAQVLTMMVRSGEIGNLWPLTLVLSAALSAPFVVAAFIGSRMGRAVRRLRAP